MSFKNAEKKGYVPCNPYDNIYLPKNKNRRVRALSLNEQKKLDVIALYSGMRIGEISEFKWSDIDFDCDLIHVSRTVY